MLARRTYSVGWTSQLVGLCVAVVSAGLLTTLIPTPAGSQTPGGLPCVGDCNDDSRVSVDELIVGVGMALRKNGLDRCPSFDHVADGAITVDELLLSVAASNDGCGPAPSPTPTVTPRIVALAEVQDTIFTPRCAVVSCHSNPFPAAGLLLEDGESFDSLVGQAPANAAAVDLGLLLVDPGNPDDSFLVVKVEGPESPALGFRMPVLPPSLTPAQIDLIRDWIAAGAPE